MQLKNKSWVEINSRNLISNYKSVQKIVGKKNTVMAVVKANAYGHGLKEIAGILCKKAPFFAVDNLKEALVVKGVCKKSDVLVIGYMTKEEMGTAIKNGISFALFDMEDVKNIVSQNLKNAAKIHIKIETGLNRLGFTNRDLPKLLKTLGKYRGKIEVEGAYTHLANVEDTTNPDFTMFQIKNFNTALNTLESNNICPKFIHAGATGAALIYPESRFNSIRLGIGLYGLWPSKENKREIMSRNKIDLEPVLAWKSVIAKINFLEKGDSVSYGRTWIAKRKSKVAVIPVGYSDGYSRALSNVGEVIIHGKRAKVVGRVAMNMFMVDITKITGVKRGDVVTLLGGEISADEIAEKIATINYEVVCRINSSLPRVII